MEGEIIQSFIAVQTSYSKPNWFKPTENFNLSSCPTSLQLSKLRLKKKKKKCVVEENKSHSKEIF